MPRIRSIKPEFFRHHDLYMAEKNSNLPIRVAFSGLWCCADKEGRFKWQPKQLKLDVLPYDDLDFEQVLACLVDNDFIRKYIVLDKVYGYIPTFKEHQRITGTEKVNESKLPSPFGNNKASQNDSSDIPCFENSELVDNELLTGGSITASQSVYKEVQEKERNNGKVSKERINKEGSDDLLWESVKKSFLNAGDWIFKFCTDKNIHVDKFDSAAKEFLSDIELKEDYKELRELRNHFTNWYNKKYKNGHQFVDNGHKLGTSAARTKTARDF